MPTLRNVFNLEFVVRGTEKTEVRIWIQDFVCYPTFEYLIGQKWRIQNTPPHIAYFCQAIYPDQIKLYETFQNLAPFEQMLEQQKDKRVKKPSHKKRFNFRGPAFLTSSRLPNHHQQYVLQSRHLKNISR